MHILDFIFPKRCVGCGRVGRYFCARCRKSLTEIRQVDAICPVCEKSAIDGATHPRCRGRYTLDGLTSFFHYEGVAKKAIQAIKYRFVSDLAKEFVEYIPETSYNIIRSVVRGEKCCVVPIALHASRLRYRGFNQAELLGMMVAHKLGVSMRAHVLVRARHTVPQVEMKDRQKRLKNMERVFMVKKTIGPGSRILLFDDVFTTGATLRSAASVLKRAGAAYVWGVTMAR